MFIFINSSGAVHLSCPYTAGFQPFRNQSECSIFGDGPLRNITCSHIINREYYMVARRKYKNLLRELNSNERNIDINYTHLTISRSKPQLKYSDFHACRNACISKMLLPTLMWFLPQKRTHTNKSFLQFTFPDQGSRYYS